MSVGPEVDIKTVVEKLKRYSLKISCAESCTGGMFSEFLTDISGASDVFELGVVSYSSRIKHKVLKVDEGCLETYGAVSRDTAIQMATHIRALADSDLGVSITGVAGPSEAEGKAVGTVYIALADAKTVKAQRLNIENIGRKAIRQTACKVVFALIDTYIEEKYAKNDG